MITTSDVANIIYRDCAVFGIEIVPDGKTIKGKLTSDRVVIHVHKEQPGTYWNKCFVEVNLCVPDAGRDDGDTVRLTELERSAKNLLRGSGWYDDSFYRYDISSIGRDRDSSLECYFINCKLLFEVLNVR